MVWSKSTRQPWLQFSDLKFHPQQHRLKKKTNVSMVGVLRPVFILVIIILKYIQNEHVQVFHIDIDILKIIILNYFKGNFFIRIEVIGIKYFEIYQFLLYCYYFQILCCQIYLFLIYNSSLLKEMFLLVIIISLTFFKRLKVFQNFISSYL